MLLSVRIQWGHAQSGQCEKVPPNVTKGENKQSAASSKISKDDSIQFMNFKNHRFLAPT